MIPVVLLVVEIFSNGYPRHDGDSKDFPISIGHYCGTILVRYLNIKLVLGAVVVVIVWKLDLQLPMQSVPIIADVVSPHLDEGDVYNIMC